MFDALDDAPISVQKAFMQSSLKAILNSDVSEETKLFPEVMFADVEFTTVIDSFRSKYAEKKISEYTDEDKIKLRKCVELLRDFKKQFEEEIL